MQSSTLILFEMTYDLIRILNTGLLHLQYSLLIILIMRK